MGHLFKNHPLLMVILTEDLGILNVVPARREKRMSQLVRGGWWGMS